jgi:trimethylamine--corrinoid protein Co-methyltransferase
MGSGGLIGNLYRPLNQSQIETIHQKALDVIEHIGLTFETGLEETLDMVAAAGCKVDRKTARIYFPRKLVEEMVARAPAEFILYSRDGKNDLHLGADRVYAGTGGSALNVLDLDTGRVRQGVLKDIYHVARLVDRLDNIHFFQRCVVPHDVPVEYYDVNSLFAPMLGTTKHIMFGCDLEKGLMEAVELASLVVGGREKLRKAPVFSIAACMIISPLKFCTQSVKNVCAAARQMVPVAISSAPMSGSTSPMTMAGTLVQTHAEELAGITVHQISNPGAPVLYGGLPGMADMRSMGYQGGGVEFGMMQTAIHQLSEFVKVPNYASSGLSDSKIPDAQAGWEKAFTTALAVMGGNNYIHHAAGMLESMLCISYEQYVMDDEIIGMACKILEGIAVDEAHMAYDAIEEVGPGGNYLMSDHTLRFIRTEYFQSNGVSDKSGRRDWEINGSMDARQRARKIAKNILSTPEEPKIHQDIATEIRKKFHVFV